MDAKTLLELLRQKLGFKQHWKERGSRESHQFYKSADSKLVLGIAEAKQVVTSIMIESREQSLAQYPAQEKTDYEQAVELLAHIMVELSPDLPDKAIFIHEIMEAALERSPAATIEVDGIKYSCTVIKGRPFSTRPGMSAIDRHLLQNLRQAVADSTGLFSEATRGEMRSLLDLRRSVN